MVELLLSRDADGGIKSEEESLQTAFQVAQAARAGPVWAMVTTNRWDEDRIDRLLMRLEVGGGEAAACSEIS